MRAIYPLKKYKGIPYNIFQVLPDSDHQVLPESKEPLKYFAKVFDCNMRVWYETYPREESHQAVLDARDTIEKIKKGQIPGCAKKIDEGKAIRDREEKEHQDFQKEQRRLRRKK